MFVTNLLVISLMGITITIEFYKGKYCRVSDCFAKLGFLLAMVECLLYIEGFGEEEERHCVIVVHDEP
jgi:hypothetical protein